MRILLRTLLVAFVLGVAHVRPAMADPPGTAGRGQLGGAFLGGVALNDSTGAGGANAGTLGVGRFNPYGFGLGLRGGYTLKNVPVYLGGVFTFFVGERQSIDILGINAKARSGYIQLAFEGGYDIGVGPVIIRPSLWIGPSILRAKACTQGDCTGDSDTSAVIGPGASVIYAFDKIPLWLGGELRFSIVPGEIVDGGANHVSGLLFGANAGLLL